MVDTLDVKIEVVGDGFHFLETDFLVKYARNLFSVISIEVDGFDLTGIDVVFFAVELGDAGAAAREDVGPSSLRETRLHFLLSLSVT